MKATRAIPAYTCGGCDNTWTGLTMCHCARCHRTFSGIRLFDTHQTRAAKCLDPLMLSVKGEPLRLVNGVWRGPAMTDDKKRQRFGE